MCETCGCSVTPGNAHLVSPRGKLERTAEGRATVEVLAGLLQENDHQAATTGSISTATACSRSI